MNITFDELNRQVDNLSLSERKALIERLIRNLDELDEAECETLWLEEANRRYQDYKQGKAGSKPASEVFSQLRNKLNQHS